MTPKLNKILIPIDFSDTAMIALDHGLFIAKKNNCEITLLYAFEKSSLFSNLRKTLIEGKSMEALEKEAVEARLSEIKSTLGAGVNIVTRTTSNDTKASKQIVEVANEIEADLIIMGTHGAKGIENFVGGSNTYRVAGTAPCPVISVHGHSGNKGIKDIVLPIDSSPETREKVDLAIFYAKIFGSTIHVAAVTSSTDNETVRNVERAGQMVKEYIEEDNIPCDTTFIRGNNITDLTLTHSNAIHADLIMIMTEQETNMTGFFMGKYAQQMINHSEIPVLSLRPRKKADAFVTPY